MMRLSAIFIAICMVLIAASCGAVLYLVLGFTGAESSIVSVAALTGLALYNAVSTRLRDRSDVGGQIADLSRGTADMARQVAELGRRLDRVEQEAAVQARAVQAAKPLSAELSELGSIVKGLAETVAAQQAALNNLPTPSSEDISPSIALAAEPKSATQPGEVKGAAVQILSSNGSDKPKTQSQDIENGPFKGMEAEAIIAVVREAVEANRIDLYLQPVVTLPQRKVRYYEAMMRLRIASGEILTPADFLNFAESGGLMPKIDSLMLFRCVQVVRRLLSKNRDISLFCNVSASSLIDPQSFPQFVEFIDANRAIAPSLVFEFTQSAYRGLGPIEFESLNALADRGFRFSMDNVTDLRFEPRDLADRGFRFIKVPATLLLKHAGFGGGDIHPADFSGLLSRFGIELIAERIENERVVVDLLDYDVRYGQGFLFSPPRPVRPEALQGIGERNDVIAREPELAREGKSSSPLSSEPAGGRPLAASPRTIAPRVRGAAVSS